MGKKIIFVLLLLIYIVNGNNYQYPNCKRLENRIYQLTITFPGLKPFYVVLRLLPNNVCDELYSIANGNNAAEAGLNLSFSSKVGYYKCLEKNVVRLTGIGYFYKTAEVPFLNETGAIALHDYYLYLKNYDRSLTGSFRAAAFKTGINPFTTSDEPVFETPIGKVKGELLRLRRFYDLSDDSIY